MTNVTTDYANRSLPAYNPPQLTYYGGKILEHPRFVSIYAGAFWQSTKGSAERNQLNSCSRKVPAGSHASVWKEYGVSKGTFAGSTVVSLPRPARAITEADVQDLVAKSIRSSQVASPDGETVYTVFLPPNAVLTLGDTDSRHGMGGFHGSYLDTSSNKRVYYAAIAYASQGNGVPFTSNSVDNMSIAASHEWSEAVTDPDVNEGKLGWYNKQYGEVGDIPITLGYPLSSLWGRVSGCAVQKEWSNSAEAPVLTSK